MAVVSSTQSVTTAAVIGTPKGSRKHMVVHNPSGAAATIWLGGSNVAVANGWPLAAGSTERFGEGTGLAADREWYAVSAGAAVTIQITEAD